MTRLWNLIEAHYLIAGFLAWAIILETSKVVRQFLRAIQLRPDNHNHTHNHVTQVQNEDETDDEEISIASLPQNPMLTRPRPQPIPRRADPSPSLLTRAERVIRNIKGGNS